MNFQGLHSNIYQTKEILIHLQKNVAIPFDNDDPEQFSQCEYYALNYSHYGTEDFIYWNRSEMISEGTGRRRCNSWVYDRSVFTETVLSRVSIKLCSDAHGHFISDKTLPSATV